MFRSAGNFWKTSKASLSGTPMRPIPVSILKLIEIGPSRATRLNSPASSKEEMVGINPPSAIVAISCGKAGPRIMIGWGSAARSWMASSKFATPNNCASFPKVSATPTRPWPYAFAFTTARSSAAPIRSRTTFALWRNALRSISAQQR